MIAKISSGMSTAGLIRYLYDTKKAKDHTDPHLVASWDGYAPDPGRTDDFDATKKLLVADLDLHVKQAERLGRAPEQHVWHCSIRAAQTDRHLSDEEWADIARRVVAATGIAPDGDADGCRWVAVRHAPDHIHIAATKVPADLRTARHWNDYLTSDRELATIEQEYGLQQVARGDRTAAKRPTRAEQEKAKRAGHDKTARERLRTAVAAATSTEEFIGLLEHIDGVLVDVKYFPSGDVRGYTVALADDTNGNQTPIWYSGSELSLDLSWPKITERLAATARPSHPWQMALAAIEHIPHALSQDDPPAAQAHITALAETIDVLPLLAPTPYQEQLRQAAAVFERASRSRIRARNEHASWLRGAVQGMLRTPPPSSADDTLLALFLDTIVLAATAAIRWHEVQRHDQQVAAAREALTHLQAAADQAAAIPLTTLARAAPISVTTQLRYAHIVRAVLPEHAERILDAPDWGALAAVLARADEGGRDPAEVLREAVGQRPLHDARRPARLIAWRIQHTTAQQSRASQATPSVLSLIPRPDARRTRR